MSTEANKTLITHFVDCLNNKETAKIEQLYSVQDTQYPYVAEPSQPPLSLELTRLFPDGRYHTEHLLTDKDNILWHWTFNSSGLSFRGANMFRAHDGKIVEDHRVGDIRFA